MHRAFRPRSMRHLQPSLDFTFGHPADVMLENASLPVFRVKLVREGTRRFDHLPALDTADDAALAAREYLRDEDREHFAVLMVDTRNKLVGIHTVSVGTISQTVVGPREVFRAAILMNAASIVVAHNHPSGHLEPSPEDIVVTRKLAHVGDLLDIPLLDHVIVGPGESFASLRRLGHFCRSF